MNVLVIEDSAADYALLERRLLARFPSARFHRVTARRELEAALYHDRWDFVLADYNLPGLSHTECLSLIRTHDRDVPIILVSGSVGEEQAVDLLKKGVADFVLKDNLARLIPAAERSLRETEERRARRGVEEALEQEAQRRRILVEQSRDGIVVLDDQGKVYEANRRYAEMLGYSLDEVHGLHVWDWDALWPRKAILEMIREVDAAGSHFETKHRRKDGTLLDVEISSNGAVVGGRKYVFCVCRDISERKKAEKDLREKLALQHQLSAIAAVAPGVLYSFRRKPDGTFSMPYATPPVEEIFGLRPADVAADAAAAFNSVHPDDLPGMLASIEESARTLQLWHHEFRLRHPRKGEIWAEAKSVPEKEADGSVLWHGFVSDVTDRKRTEAALLESETRLRSILENAKAIIWVKSLEGRFLVVNGATAAALGVPRERLLGSTVHDLFPREEADEFEANDQAVIQQGQPCEFEETASLGGQTRTFLAVKFPLRDERGVLLGLAAICTDITERKRAEAALRLQGAALAAAANLIVITDRNGVIEWANPAFTRCSGYTLEEALGKRPGDLVKSGVHPRRFYEKMWETILAGNVWQGEVVNRRKDGELYHEDMTITPLRNPHGEITNFIAIKQDVTERKNLEAQLLRTQRLESVGRLASGIAHDLNNILSPVLMGAGILREVIEDPAALEIVDSIEEGGNRGAAIIKQLLAFGRGSQPEWAPIPLRSLVRDMVKLVEETFPKNISVEKHIPPELLLVNGDATQIHQVLMNLCVNARDAMPDGGTLTLSIEPAEVDKTTARSLPDAQPGSYVMLGVSDTGSGIPPEIMDKIFDPFFTTKALGEGTGLGLSTALGIVRAHRGFLRVESRPGEGTRFRVYFPAADGRAMAEERVAAAPLPQGTGEWVLLVDDEEGIRRVTRQMLERNGYHVLAAENGRDALSVYRTNCERISVVLTDLLMPEMDGAALIRALREEGATAKVVILSGYLSQPELVAALEAEAQAFIAKPVTAGALLETLRRVLAR